jgi:hypothetical protein
MLLMTDAVVSEPATIVRIALPTIIGNCSSTEVEEVFDASS